MSSEYGSPAQGSHRHVVQFYDRDEELAENVGNYLAGAIAEGGAAVIVATPVRCAAFEERLAAGGVDVAAARRGGTLVCLDAARVTRGLTQAGRIDLTGFNVQFRPAILAAGEAPGPVRIYGEAVALLWAAGHVNAALKLEGLWNELASEIPFSLYCGYPRHLVESSQFHGAVGEVCRLHTAVVGGPVAGGPAVGGRVGGGPAVGRPGAAAPSASLGGPADPAGSSMAAADPAARAYWADAARTFAGTREGPRAARGFVLGMLAPWHGEQLAADTALVVTELATNAMRHAGSSFSVSLVLSGRTIRISVGDTLPLGEPGGDPGLPATPGHGLGVIAAVAARWGVESRPGGKAVWAELPLPD